MLPPSHRLTRSADFGAVVRSGRRTKTAALVVHHRRGVRDESAPALVGFVVSRAVGNSVVRHRVSRRLRAQMMPLLGQLPGGSATVVRALPGSAAASSSTLAGELSVAVGRLAAR